MQTEDSAATVPRQQAKTKNRKSPPYGNRKEQRYWFSDIRDFFFPGYQLCWTNRAPVEALHLRTGSQMGGEGGRGREVCGETATGFKYCF
jgi:hypothetical protein